MVKFFIKILMLSLLVSKAFVNGQTEKGAEFLKALIAINKDAAVTKIRKEMYVAIYAYLMAVRNSPQFNAEQKARFDFIMTAFKRAMIGGEKEIELLDNELGEIFESSEQLRAWFVQDIWSLQ